MNESKTGRCQHVTGCIQNHWDLDLTMPKNFPAMIRENQQLVTDEPVEFEKKPVEIQDCKKITDRFRGIYRIYPNLIKENRRLSNM
jgi:hypothetical protein